MKDAARKSYARKGDAVVASNVAAIEEGAQKCVEVAVPASWANAELDELDGDEGLPAVVANILRPVNAQKGDELPVSAFAGYEDGVIDMGLTAFEKRGIAVTTPMWKADACIQCNRCAFVCAPTCSTRTRRKTPPKGSRPSRSRAARTCLRACDTPSR